MPRVVEDPLSEDFNKFEFAWNILTNSQEMIKLADQKIQITMLLSTVLFSFLLTNMSNYIAKGQNYKYLIWIFLLALLSFIVLSLLSLFAHSAKKTGDSVPKLIFFGHVAQKKEAHDYSCAFSSITPDQALDDVCYQIYEISIIAQNKFRFYNLSWIALIVQIATFIAVVAGGIL